MDDGEGELDEFRAQPVVDDLDKSSDVQVVITRTYRDRLIEEKPIETMYERTAHASGATYVGAYVGMDLCQRIFPCFDQNDLKAPVTLTVVAPAGWSVVANGRLVEQTDHETHGTWRFGTTPPIPLPMFTVCAGPWHSIRWEHAGSDGQVVPFAWHARASLARQLDRDAAELRAVTDACYDEYLTMFTEPFAFGSFDQVFVPGLNWGALENPGCVTYRDEILPVGTPTEGERKILLELQGSVNQPRAVRDAILKRAKVMAIRRIEDNKRKADAIRSGAYFEEGYGMPNSGDGWSVVGVE